MIITDHTSTQAAKRKTVKRKAIEDEFAMGMRLIKQRVETTYRTELARK